MCVAFGGIQNDFGGLEGAIERIFPWKIMKVAIAKGNMIRKELQRLKINEDVEKFSKDIKHDLMDGAK